MKSWLIGKDSDAGRDWGQEEKGTTEDEMAGWHHWLDGHGSEWTPGVGDGQGGLACCDSWGRKESDTTEWLIWSDLNAYIQNLEKWYWRIYLQGSSGETDIENRLMDMGRGEERVRCMERITWKLTCKIDSQWEFAIWLRKIKQGLCINLEGWDEVGDGWAFQKGGGYMCTYGWLILRFGRKQQNSVKQLSFNKK